MKSKMSLYFCYLLKLVSPLPRSRALNLELMVGGFGINLACANVVIIFDGSFNPHDDKQAEDRAHRVGQTRDVTVVRLVVKDTIEEHILHLANTKLVLDQEMSV